MKWLEQNSYFLFIVEKFDLSSRLGKGKATNKIIG